MDRVDIANKLVPILEEMQQVECITNECGGCDLKCELIQTDGECLFFSLKNIVSELLGYEYVLRIIMNQ